MTEGGCKICKEWITPDSSYMSKKFIDDDKQNKIRLDKIWFHILKSHEVTLTQGQEC